MPAGRLRQRQRGAALLRRARPRERRLAGRRRRRRARQRHRRRAARRPACRRRRSSRRPPTRRSSIPSRCGRACTAATGAARACSSCAATAAATGSPSDSSRAGRAGRHGERLSTPRAGLRRRSARSARRRDRRRRRGLAVQQLGGDRQPRAALAGRGPLWRAARAVATHPRIAARARSLGFGVVVEAAPGLDAVIACIQSIATVNDDPSPAAAPRDLAFSPVTPAPAAPAAIDAAEAARRAARAACRSRSSLLALLAVVALVFAWRADQRVRGSERELVKRQQDSARPASPRRRCSRARRRRARATPPPRSRCSRRASTKSRVQRGQLEELIQSVSRSRDENLVADIEATLRAGLQQAALTGSAEPVVAALKQIDERFARANQPRLEPVRRAVARDLDRVKAASVADVATLSIRLDEAVRLVDELPLLSAAEPRRDLARGGRQPRPRPASAPRRRAASATGCRASSARPGASIVEGAWSEIRSLVRVTRIDQPEAMLVAPDQAFFLQENLKLRLLNARLSLLARQFDAARGDLRWCQGRDRALLRPLVAAHADRARPDQAGRAAVAPVGAGAARRHLRRARRVADDARASLAPLAGSGRAGRPAPGRADQCASRSGSSSCSPSRSSRRRPSAPTTAWRASTGARGGSTCRSTCSSCSLVGTCFLLVAVIQAINSLIGLPQRAREWRTARRDRTGQAALRDALAQYFGGRYTRAQKSAQRALAIQAETPELAQDNEFTVLGHLLAAGSAHRVQNRALRDEELRRALDLAASQPGGALGRGGRAPARRRMGARRPRCAARDRAAQRAAARRRAPHARAAPEAAGRAARPAAAGGVEDGAAADQAPGLLDGRRRPAWCARSPSNRSTPSTTSISCAGSGCRSIRPIGAIRSSPRARPCRRARSAPTTMRGPGCVRTGIASPSSASRSAPRSPRRLPAPSPASARNGCRASSRRCRRLPRDGAVALAAGSALAARGLWGKARSLLEQAAADVDARRRRRAARPGSRSPSWPHRRATRAARHAATRAPHARPERVALLQLRVQRL